MILEAQILSSKSQISLYKEQVDADLQLYIRDVFSQGHPSTPINDLNSDGSLAFCLENVIDKILWGKIDVASSVRVMLT